MRTPLVVFFLTAVALAGCLGGDDGAPDGDDSPTSESDAMALSVTLSPTGLAGAEPNMGITSSGAVFATAFSNVVRSTDDLQSWEVVHTHSLPNSDPMMWVDPWTDTVYNAPMFPTLLCATIYASGDDGASWSQVPSPNCGRSVYDHQKLASALPAAGNPAAGVAHPTVLVMCYNAIETTNCATSYDGGLTWPHDAPAITNGGLVPTPVDNDCGSGQNGHPTGGPDGTIAFGKTWLCSTPYLVYSTDSGLTWTSVAAPADVGSSMLDPEIAFTPDGTLYFLYRGDDGHAYLLRTTDLGATWAGPFDVTPPGVEGTVFGALAAGDDGRIAFGFLGNRVPQADGDPSTADDDAVWHLYMGASLDANATEPTFDFVQATPDEDPVQLGCVWLSGGGNPCRNLLDFIDGAVDPAGRFHVAFADGCTEGCAGEPDATPDDSRDRTLVIARLEGVSLYQAAAAGNATAN